MISAFSNRKNHLSLKDYVYLNQASLGLVSQLAIEAMHIFLDDVARHGNLNMSDDDEVGFFKSLRTSSAKLLNCNPEQVAIVASASELLGQLPFLIQPKPKTNIITIATDFPAVTRPWIRYAVDNDCSLKFIEDSASENLTNSIIETIDSKTSVVAVSYVQFSTGSMIDVPRLREATNEVGAKLIVDVTQAAGILKIDSQNWQADAIVTSGYKWLGGHGGVALGVVRESLLEEVPLLPGWMSTPSPFDFDATTLAFAPDARRFTQSTMSYVSLVGLTIAIEELLSIEQKEIEAHSFRLAQHLLTSISEYGWKPFQALKDSSASPHIITITHPKLDVEKVVQSLRDNKIVCGSRNGRIRISLAPYNNSDDIDALVNVLGEMDD